MASEQQSQSKLWSCASLHDGIDQLVAEAQQIADEEEETMKLIKDRTTNTKFWQYILFQTFKRFYGLLMFVSQELEATTTTVHEQPLAAEKKESWVCTHMQRDLSMCL